MSSQMPDSTRFDVTLPVLTGGNLFEYTELTDEHDIRLLRLDDSTSYSRQGTINGKLEHVSMDDFVNGNTPPQYSAMSYCWGDPVPTDRIWLSESAYLPINAAAAHVLRSVKGGQDIWIDSVCINQCDNDEKSRQVMMMWGIYYFAERVVAWLGGPEDDAKLAMQLIVDAAHPFATEAIWGRSPVWLPEYPSCHRFHFDALAWRALAKLLERPWFRRVWVIREIVAAKLVWLTCDTGSRNDIVDWEDLVKLIEHLERWGYLNLLGMKDSSKPWAQPILPRGVEGIKRIQNLKCARDGERQSMQENLVLTTTAEASDPRDKVFALGSMSRGTLVEALVPQYHLSACEVFTNATRYMITFDKSILVLRLAGIGWTRSQKDLPSWVPDYSCPCNNQNARKDNRRNLVVGHIAGREIYSPGSPFSYNEPAKIMTFPSLPNVVGINGVIVDKVEKVCHGLPPARSIWNSLTAGAYSDRKEVLSWLNNIRNNICPSFCTGRAYLNSKALYPLSILDALWCTLIGGFNHKNVEFPHDKIDGRELFDAFLALLLHTVSSQDENPKIETFDRERLEKARAYVQALDRLLDWTAFRTSLGYVGRGPPHLQKGDHVCVFLGGRTPFVIRTSRSALFDISNCYKLVGECYVEGLMKNEALYMSRLRWGPILLE